MASKSEAGGAAILTCRVCGGEVNARKECVVCGTKQMDPPKTAGGEQDLTAWLKGDAGDNGLSSWIGTPVSSTGSPDAKEESLRKWLAGEDGAFQDWIGLPVGGAAAARQVRTGERGDDDKLREMRAKAFEAEGLRAELEAMRVTLARELANFRSGKFDPVQYIEEVANLSKQIQTEIAKRKELQQEIEHIKKGSIAVIKYVKAQQLKAGPSADLKKKLEHETAARSRLEAEIRELKKVNEVLKDKIEVGLTKLKPTEKSLKKREIELAEREATMTAREEMSRPAEEKGVPESEELKRRLEEELRENEQEFLRVEEALKKKIITLEEQVSKFKIEDQVRSQAQALEGKPKADLGDALAKMEHEVLAREKSVLLREQEIQRLREELDLKEDELKKLKEPLQYKEEELLRREQDLLYQQNVINEERRKLEHLKAEGVSTEEKDLKARLEELKSEITRKEEEVRTKESYLAQKMEELRLREQGLISEEIEAREEERQVEFKQQKVKTGIARLDDLLFGGIPFGSNVSIYGPAYVGKEVVTNLFMSEGLKKGLPVLWVLTDKSPGDIREEMAFVLPGYEEYEKLGLVKYVDAYSKSMGAEANDPNTTYIDDPTDHGAILKAVDALAAEWKKKHESYRLAFRSVSTLIAYLDPTTTFKFLQPFVGRRKRDKAVAMFIIEKGMHEEQEIQMLGSLMDGSVEFKVEQLKSFLSIKGICDVQSRSWIRYTYTKGSVSIGSFSLDHIK
ncbi:MAG TPA: ATPase domain-containing protein [Thermoplasmata archaeon]